MRYMAITAEPKERKRKPSVRARKAFDKFVENRGKSVSAAMREAGYSTASAKNPSNLTKSQTWAEMLEEYLPDDLLGEKHKEFLLGKRIIRTTKRGDLTVKTEETDPSAVKALDMAYKLKRRYGDVNIGQAVVLNITGAAASKYGVDTLPSSQNATVERVDSKDAPSIKEAKVK